MEIIKAYPDCRLVKTIGHYMEYRYEVQEKYNYYERKGKRLEKIEAWHMVFFCHHKDLEYAKEVLEKHHKAPKRIYKTPFAEFNNELPFMA